MTMLIIKALLPVICYALTELIKYTWEKYQGKMPPTVSISLATGLGAVLTQITPIFGADPVLGALLGAASAAVHDICAALGIKVSASPKA